MPVEKWLDIYYNCQFFYFDKVDLNRCLSDVRSRYPDPTMQDIVRSFLKVIFLSPENEIKVLKKILLRHRTYGPIIYNRQFCYWLHDTNLAQPYRGEWCKNDYMSKGKGILSLVKNIYQYSDIDALLYIADAIDVDFSTCNVKQSKYVNKHTYINNTNLNQHYIARHNIFNFLGNPISNYWFYNNDRYSNIRLLQWIFNHEFINIFFTLYEDSYTGEKFWEYMFPPTYGEMIFNRWFIENDKIKEVHIHDQIAMDNYSNLEQNMKNHIYNEQAIITWSGDLSFSSELDWDFLKGRNVFYIFDKSNKNSMIIGDQLIRKFSRIGTTLKLHDRSEWKHLG